MRQAPETVAVLVLCVAAAMAGTARADPIIIRDGVFVFDTGDPPSFRLSGDEVSLTGLAGIATSGAFTCREGCAIGTPVDLGTVVGGAEDDFRIGPAFGTVHGVRYGPGEDPDPLFPLSLTGTLTFDGPAVAVPDRGDFVNLTAPFMFTAHVAGFFGEPSGDPLFELDLAGGGRATMLLARLDPAGDTYEFRSAAYLFSHPAPVPEPATLLLIGSGLAGVWIRRRRVAK